MQALQFYRYLMACRPSPPTLSVLAEAGAKAGQQLRADRYHLTFCVIAEVCERHFSISEEVGPAFADTPLPSAPVRFGHVVGGSLGAMMKTVRRQVELQDLYAAVVRRLALTGFEPMHRKSGFRPHVTLGHDPCSFLRFDISHEWIPSELLLIESEVGLTRHNVLCGWPLLPPRQMHLPFGGAACPQ